MIPFFDRISNMLTLSWKKIFISILITLFIVPFYIGKIFDYFDYVDHDYGRNGALYFAIPKLSDLALFLLPALVVTFIIVYVGISFLGRLKKK